MPIKKYTTVFTALTIILMLAWSGCAPAETVQDVPAETPVPATPAPKPPFTADISQPVISGSAHAVFSAAVSGENGTEPIESAGFVLTSESGTQQIEAVMIDDVYYATVDSLSPDTAYRLGIMVMADGESVSLDETLEFSTPAQTLSEAEVNARIDTALADESRDEENRLLLETQACLNLMGMETESYGYYGPLTQANLTRISYSLYSLGPYADYTRINTEPDEALLSSMKDILSVNPEVTEANVIHTFTPAPYALTAFAVLNNDGGSLDIETYIMEQIAKDETIKALYAEYPYDQTTSEFKEMYADIINGDLGEDAKATKLAGYAAKNKALFSYESGDWMLSTSMPKEPLVIIAGSDNEITINTMAAYAYLLIDAYRETGKVFQTSTTYRTCETQWLFYSKKSSDNVAKSRNGSWHLRRQMYSYVPGYSNHQYGVAIDFYERNSFGGTVLFDYMVQHGNDYGFYNYYLEPWHWAYLGKVF